MLKLLIKTFLISIIIQATLFSREIYIDKIVKKEVSLGKHLFVWLHQTDCGYCESMKEFTLDDEDIKVLIKKKFVFVHININEKDKVMYKDFVGNGRAFAKHIGYNFYPTSLFFDSNNKLIYAVPGYKDEKIFFSILKYIDSKSYKTMEFESYVNEADFNEEL
ncbi:thioredoxin fold domain-containing protein [Sulfurimonas sp.]|uniref:thioredoxin family protein n=1 Tax=Sulfurimonas sp. TaxID=2022749 RepID=UPI0025F838C8|nr:thioredoxin fold domain-containing protein [Sulfurimonas sp.]